MNTNLTEKDARSYFELCGFTVQFMIEAVNPYWRYRYGDMEAYGEPIRGSQWICMTEYGLIAISWRKRVMEVQWNHTALRKTIDEENAQNTTTCDTLFHAYDMMELMKRLQALKAAFVHYYEYY